MNAVMRVMGGLMKGAIAVPIPVLLWCAAFACALVAGAAAAGDASLARSGVWAIGLPDGYVIMEHQAAVIEVTAEDVAMGVVEVRGGSRFMITTHAPARYAVDFFTRRGFFQAVGIGGIGRPAELGPTGGTVDHREATVGKRVIRVDYRFVLPSDTTPGTYEWPLQMSVRGTVPSDLRHPGGDGRLVTMGAPGER